jgi:hypothetical protein
VVGGAAVVGGGAEVGRVVAVVRDVGAAADVVRVRFVLPVPVTAEEHAASATQPTIANPTDRTTRLVARPARRLLLITRSSLDEQRPPDQLPRRPRRRTLRGEAKGRAAREGCAAHPFSTDGSPVACISTATRRTSQQNRRIERALYRS